MLPKSDRSKQLDLVETLSQDQQLSAKRRVIGVILALTILIPLVFTFRRHLSLPKVNRPASNFDQVINSVIGAQTSSWIFFIGQPSQGQLEEIWSKNLNQIDPFHRPEKLLGLTQAAPLLTSGPLIKLLPQGLEVRQLTLSSLPLASFYINLPKRPFLIVIKAPSTPMLNQFLPQLIEQLFWQFTSRL
jgi:hypothetical protein